ncbi:uncharacterized protein C8Q71DRAFT_168036 [Rhodofomes roseus]|uniref:F-box domain-containing protein n=1 Tax=Rhodofomes roseus TaxID=34475 RepID=A0ABQ8K8J1_9APHY|nr:uncharacterized protein C8Q71DRAFT_168036 [Rhodofomes roseus]KAH9833641.1 hypothetical protein C8Q71DRAFT_168036 [Rhodofomes roseus]
MSELSYVDAEEIAEACKSADYFDGSSSNSRNQPLHECHYIDNAVGRRPENLPAELLVEAMTYIVDGDTDASWWQSISLVSRYWHGVAREAAVLWSSPWASYNPKLFRAAIERSRTFPLDVNIAGPFSWCLAALDAVRPHADRVWRLAFGPGPEQSENIPLPDIIDMSYLDFEVPNLTDLHLDLQHFAEQTPFVITHSRYPRLRDLTLEAATTPCDKEAYAALTNLTLLDQHHIEGFEQTLEDFAAMLRACTHLQYLHIEESGPDGRNDHELMMRPTDPRTTVRLSRLRVLGLRDEDKNTALILKHITFPRRTCIYITMIHEEHLPSGNMQGFCVTPSVEKVLSKVEVIRVVTWPSFRIRIELQPSIDKKFEWDSCEQRSCIGLDLEGPSADGELDICWSVMALTTNPQKLAAAPLKCLIIQGRYWDTHWRRFLMAFPSLEEIRIEDYERLHREFYEALTVRDPRTGGWSRSSGGETWCVCMS